MRPASALTALALFHADAVRKTGQHTLRWTRSVVPTPGSLALTALSPNQRRVHAKPHAPLDRRKASEGQPRNGRPPRPPQTRLRGPLQATPVHPHKTLLALGASHPPLSGLGASAHAPQITSETLAGHAPERTTKSRENQPCIGWRFTSGDRRSMLSLA